MKSLSLTFVVQPSHEGHGHTRCMARVRYAGSTHGSTPKLSVACWSSDYLVGCLCAGLAAFSRGCDRLWK